MYIGIKTIKDKINLIINLYLIKLIIEQREVIEKDLFQTLLAIRQKSQEIANTTISKTKYKETKELIKNLRLFIKENKNKISDKKLKTIIINLDKLLSIILWEGNRTKNFYFVYYKKLKDCLIDPKFSKSKFLNKKLKIEITRLKIK